MSCPISFCLVSKAACGDEVAFNILYDKMEYNLGQMWSQISCKCVPPCPQPTSDQIDTMNKRLNELLDERNSKRGKK